MFLRLALLFGVVLSFVPGLAIRDVISQPQGSGASIAPARSAQDEQQTTWNRDFIAQLSFHGDWESVATLNGTRWRPTGVGAHSVSYKNQHTGSDGSYLMPLVGEVFIGDIAVVFNFVNQDTFPAQYVSDQHASAPGAALFTTTYNWNNVISFTTSGGCWGSRTTANGCSSQSCKSEGGDCTFTVITASRCFKHTCTCGASLTINGWTLCKGDSTFSTDCPQTAIDC